MSCELIGKLDEFGEFGEKDVDVELIDDRENLGDSGSESAAFLRRILSSLFRSWVITKFCGEKNVFFTDRGFLFGFNCNTTSFKALELIGTLCVVGLLLLGGGGGGGGGGTGTGFGRICGRVVLVICGVVLFGFGTVLNFGLIDVRLRGTGTGFLFVIVGPIFFSGVALITSLSPKPNFSSLIFVLLPTPLLELVFLTCCDIALLTSFSPKPNVPSSVFVLLPKPLL